MAVSTGPTSLAAPFSLADEYFNHTGSALTNGADITTTLVALAGRTGASGTLHVRAPDTDMTLYCNALNFGALNINKFGFLEGAGNVTVRLNGTGYALWQWLVPVYELVIGALTQQESYRLTLRGTWTPSNRSASGSCTVTTKTGLIDVVSASGYTATGPLAIRCNTDRPKGNAIQFSGSTSARTYPNATLYVSGRHKSGGIRANAIKGNVFFEDAVFTDPYCRGRGWAGAVSGGYGTVTTSLTELQSLYLNWSSTVGNVSGAITCEYGDVEFFWGFRDNATDEQTFGQSADDPLSITWRGYGYSGPEATTDLGWPAGVRMANPCWYKMCFGKMDGMSWRDEGRYLRFVDDESLGVKNWKTGTGSDVGLCFFMESDATDGGEGGTVGRQVSYMNYQLVRCRGFILRETGVAGSAAENYDNAIHHLTYRGDGINPAMVYDTSDPVYATKDTRLWLSIYDTLEHAQVYHVTIDKSGALNSNFRQRGVHNTISNCTFTGKLTVGACDAEGGNTATNVKFIGASREIIEIQAGGQLDITNLQAPAGSSIDVQSGATVRIWNGSGWTTLGTGSHTFSSAWTTDSSAIPADIPLTGAEALPIGKPASDVSSTGWLTVPSGSAVYEVLNEDSVDSADYVFTTQSSQTFEVALNAVSDPLSATGHVVLWSGKGSYTLSLRQGSSTEIAAWTKDDASEQLYAETLTETQANSITDYSDLRIRVVSGS